MITIAEQALRQLNSVPKKVKRPSKGYLVMMENKPLILNMISKGFSATGIGEVIGLSNRAITTNMDTVLGVGYRKKVKANGLANSTRALAAR